MSYGNSRERTQGISTRDFLSTFKITEMPRRTWISYCVIPCPGIDCCEFYKPGEVNHPLQHEVKKVMSEEDDKFNYANSSSNNLVSSNKNNKTLVLSGTFLDNLTPVPFDPKLDPPKITVCFNCWHTNHKLKDCYGKKRDKFCSNCGRKHVKVEDCPRCKKAYCEYLEEQEHIQAKIELYGDFESADYYGTTKEPAKKPVRSKSTEKNDNALSGNSCGNDSKTKIATNTNAADVVSSNDKESRYKDEDKHDCKKVNTSFVKELKSMNLNIKEELKPKMLSANQNQYILDLSNRDGKLKKKSKVDSNQVNCEGLKKVEEVFQSYNRGLLSNMLEDENEDLDDMIFVDEDDKSVKSNAVEPKVTEESNQAYQHLLNTIKNLPEAAQKVAIHCFLNSQKKKEI